MVDKTLIAILCFVVFFAAIGVAEKYVDNVARQQRIDCARLNLGCYEGGK